MKRYAKFGYAASFRFRVILEKPQGGGQNDPPTRAKVNHAFDNILPEFELSGSIILVPGPKTSKRRIFDL